MKSFEVGWIEYDLNHYLHTIISIKGKDVLIFIIVALIVALLKISENINSEL